MEHNSIQRIIEIPLEEIQTDKGKKEWSNGANGCAICGKKIKDDSPVKYVHCLTNGNIVSYEGSDIEGSQGFFPIGLECAKKLVVKFAF